MHQEKLVVVPVGSMVNIGSDHPLYGQHTGQVLDYSLVEQPDHTEELYYKIGLIDKKKPIPHTIIMIHKRYLIPIRQQNQPPETTQS